MKLCVKIWIYIDPNSLQYLGKLINQNKDNIKIVLSSTWRLNQKGIDKVKEKIFETIGYEIPFDITGRHKDMIRGYEIEKYLLDNNLEQEDYIIIDDDTFDITGDKYKGKLDFTKHMVECNHDFGFQEKKYQKAVKILKNIPDGFPFNLEEDEEIKQIKEYPDYWISNYGNVFSYKYYRKKNNGWIKMKNRIKHNRYKYIFLSKNDKTYEFSIHYLVAKNFCNNYSKDKVVNHIDANGLNNYYKNLEWVTIKENINKSYVTSGINQIRNYRIYNIILPNGDISEDVIGIGGIKKYISEHNLNCSALSLAKYGYSKEYKILRRNKNEI